MKILIFILLLFVIACHEPIVEPIIPEILDYSGIWMSNTKINPTMFSIFMKHEGTTIIGDIYYDIDRKYIGSFDNGKLIDNKYLSFSYIMITPFGNTSMAFNGAFYDNELRGSMSGRVYLGPSIMMQFEPSIVKFNKVKIEYFFKRG